MRALLFIFFVWCPGALALDSDYQPENWLSPNGRYAVREKFSGEGLRVIYMFVDHATGKVTRLPQHSARDLHALWSFDGRFVVVNADFGKYLGSARLYRVHRGLIKEVKLPREEMEPTRFLAPRTRALLATNGHLSLEGLRATRWISSNRVEFVSSTDAVLPDITDNEAVEQHLIVKISHNRARIIRSFRGKTSEPT